MGLTNQIFIRNAGKSRGPDFAKYVGPMVKYDRNLTGPIKPTFFSDQMSVIVVQDRISVLTDVRSGFPRFSSVAWFPLKVKILMEGLFRGKRGQSILLMGQSVKGIKSMGQIEKREL